MFQGPMIESIVVLCASREERQRWIELIQEQGTSLLKSPTVSRVSYHHPPYARLSRYFAKLVRRKVIYPELMKKLLYIQYILKPDLSNVKMRKCNVTYTIVPVYSSEETNSDISTESCNARDESRVLCKSTLIMDVRYVVDNTDLSTVGIAGNSSLTNFATRNYGDRSTFETSKSLPAIATMSHILSNVPLASSKSYASNFQARCDKFCREHLDILHKRECCSLTVNHLKAIELGPRTLDLVQRSVISTQRDKCDSIEREMRTNTSLRSSDSGMAESYHLNSSEINSSYKSYASSHTKYTDPIRMSHSESENDENKFEHQCICTSPFGSTPRNSSHSLASSKNIDECTSLVRSGVSDIGDGTNNNSSNDGKGIQETVAIHSLINYGNVNERRYTQPIPYAHQCVIKKVGRRIVRPIQPIMEENDEPTNQVYSSGLYAHWWLKKTIPISGCTEQGKLP